MRGKVRPKEVFEFHLLSLLIFGGAMAGTGYAVTKGGILAEFDRTSQLDAARDAQAKFEDLSHQVRQKTAQNKVEVEKRGAELKEAEADLAKAEIQLRKGPVLNEIDRLKNEAKAESARAKVESLRKIDQNRRQAEAAALHILELQMERDIVLSLWPACLQ